MAPGHRKLGWVARPKSSPSLGRVCASGLSCTKLADFLPLSGWVNRLGRCRATRPRAIKGVLLLKCGVGTKPCITCCACCLLISAFPIHSISLFLLLTNALQTKTAKCLELWKDFGGLWLAIRWIVFRPDITKIVDWALKTNFLPTYQLLKLLYQKASPNFLPLIFCFTPIVVCPDIPSVVDWALRIKHLSVSYTW